MIVKSRSLLFVALAILLLAFPWLALVQAAPESRCVEIHEELLKADVPVVVVRQMGDKYEVVLEPNCSDQMRQLAEQIRDRVLSSEPPVIEVSNLQDALVVLRFEPHNESALQLVKARYEALRSAAREGGN